MTAQPTGGDETPRHRGYRGPADLRLMQAALARGYRDTHIRVGDLAWLVRNSTHRELAGDIHLWEGRDQRLLGWTFYRHNGGFNVFVTPGPYLPNLLEDMLDVIDQAERNSIAAGVRPASVYTYGLDDARAHDRAVIAALRRRGFDLEPGETGVLARELGNLGDLPVPELPPYHRLGPVRTDTEVTGRVGAQRAAFAPSTLTLEKYRRVRRTWPYRAELDRIVTDREGTVVAFCTAWLDEDNAAGVFEPVGTRPAHQRRGLGYAVCLDALRVLRDAGARTAQVSYGSRAGHGLYRSLGFEPAGQDLTFRRHATR